MGLKVPVLLTLTQLTIDLLLYRHYIYSYLFICNLRLMEIYLKLGIPYSELNVYMYSDQPLLLTRNIIQTLKSTL